MIMQEKFALEVHEICEADSRYATEGYHFIREGLDHTLKSLKRSNHHPGGHVTGQELLHGIRDYALREFGPMSKLVLNEWGILTCEDIGQVVFNLVSKGVLGKTDNDSPTDFQNGFSFDEAFVDPFKPRHEEETAAVAPDTSRTPLKRKRKSKGNPQKATEDLL